MKCLFSVVNPIVATALLPEYIAANKEYLTNRRIIFRHRLSILSDKLAEIFVQIR